MVQFLAVSAPVFADQQDIADETEAAATSESAVGETVAANAGTIDEEEPGKTKDPNRGRLLPIPIFITEPAIGEGLGLALAYFHRQKDTQENPSAATPSSIASAPNDQAAPPTVTGFMAAYTNDETAAVGIGHMNTFKDDHVRFTGLAAMADVNSTFYLLDQPFKFNLKGALFYQETRFRLGDSKWFLGVGLSYLDASSNFELELPDESPVNFFPRNVINSGLSAKLAWDSRNNTSMPDKGQLVDLALWRYDEAFNGDFDYWNARLKLLSFHPISEKFVLGLRFEYSTIDGRAPFFAIPWISLRGIPAMRYQGDRVGVFEIEGRYNFSPKWALIGFTGSGAVSSNLSIIDTDQDIYSYGLGARYQIFEAQNIWIGIDAARGPEDTNWYIQVGQAW